MYWITDADKKVVSLEHVVSFEVYCHSEINYDFGCLTSAHTWHVLKRGFSTREEALEYMEKFIWTIQHSVFAAKMSDEETKAVSKENISIKQD